MSTENTKLELINESISNKKIIESSICYINKLSNNENIEKLIEFMCSNGLNVIDNLSNPYSNKSNIFDKQSILDFFDNETTLVDYSLKKWHNKEIDIYDFINFLLLAPNLFKMNTKGKYQIYMDYIHIYLNISLNEYFFPKYHLVQDKYEYITNIRDEYLYAFWCVKVIKNHKFINKYMNIVKPEYQKH